jgi:hypothetical protein
VCGVRAQAPSRQARGYGAAHERARASLAAMLPAPCACGCGAVLDVGSDWVAAHLVDGNPSAGWAAMCRSGNERMKRRGWGSASDGTAPAGTRVRQSEARPGFGLFLGGAVTAPKAWRADSRRVRPRAPLGAGVAR